MAWTQHLLSVIGRLTVALTLMVCSLHPCTAAYIGPSGEVCQECIVLVDACDEVTAATEHGDCHDCCELSGCEDAHQDEPATRSDSSPTDPLLGILVNPWQTAIIELTDQPGPTSCYSEGCPASGPPKSHSSRAPPIFLQNE